MLQIWLEHLRAHGIGEVLINTHWHATKIHSFLDEWRSDEMNVVHCYEPTLLGTAGTLLANRQWLDNGEPFFILYGDMLTNVDLWKMMRFHTMHGLPFTLSVFKAIHPKHCGVAEIDSNDTVIGFEEKPAHPKSELAAAGMYIANPEIFDAFQDVEQSKGEQLDLGFHIIPGLVGRMKAYLIREFLVDIGTQESYRLAEALWPGRCDP